MGRLLKALTEDVVALVRLWLHDHIVAPPSAEHGVVALVLTAMIAGSFCCLLFLLASGRHRDWRRAWDGCRARMAARQSPACVNSVPARAPEVGPMLRKRRVCRRHKGSERHEPYLHKFFSAGQPYGSTYVNMQRQRLTKCPDQVGFAGYNIVVVNLSHNALETIPESFVCLRGLRELRLDFNRLRDLPLELASLPALEILSLAHNAFSTYPVCISGIPLLKTLDLSHNRLTALLPGARRSNGTFIHLELLRLGFNRLRFLPDPPGWLPSLRELDLSHNRLECLPHDWSGLRALERLNLSRNCLHSVTPRLHLCSSLRVLLLSNNKLRQLPSNLFTLFNLCCLDISHNRLRFLPKSVLNIRCATELKAAGNPWLEHDLEPASWSLDSERVFGPQALPEPLKSRCCRSEWLKAAKSPLALMEAAAAVVIESVQWSESCLPSSLHEFLLSIDHCIFCSATLFPPHYCRCVGFFQDSNVWLPFSDATCPSLEPV